MKGVTAGLVAKHFFQRCKLVGGWLVFIGQPSVKRVAQDTRNLHLT